MRNANRRADLLVQVVENSPVSLVTFDERFRITYANKYHSILYGYGREESIGKRVYTLSASADPEQFFRDAAAVARANGVWRGEDDRSKKDGSAFPSSSSITYLCDDSGAFLCYLDASREIWDRAAREENLRKISYRDPLTGVENRRAFDEAFEREWRHALDRHTELSLLMVDIDFFKRFNDSYGHLAGDDCLTEVARSIATTVRSHDLVCRFGGEEFVVMLPATSEQGAITVAEKVREAVEALGRTHNASRAAEVVTVSIGIASVVPDGRLTGADLISAADKALYRAKRDGRNRVQAFGNRFTPSGLEF